MSDREGHGHKAVVYKSHFPATKALHSQSVVTETPTDTLANKPRLLQRPSSLLFMPPTTDITGTLCMILLIKVFSGVILT